jgi:hypothetical protein
MRSKVPGSGDLPKKKKIKTARVDFCLPSATSSLLFAESTPRPTNIMSNDRETTTAGNVLLSQPVVIDNGTASIKAGFAGSSKPKVVVATKVGRTKHQRVMPGGALEDNVDSSNNQQYYCGNKLDEHRGAFYLEHPMDHGEIQSWEAMERLWEVRSILS